MKKTLASILAWLLLLPAAMAQQNVIGQVTDGDTGEPIPGVSILVRGTGQGTITDIDGTYNLSVDQENAVLVYSFLGYIKQEVAVGNRSEINVTLEPDLSDLEEVIVVGYGVQKKKVVTGATVQVDGDKLKSLSTTQPLEALQGLAPGVQISATSGQPGESMRVVIRGLGTIGDASPLYVVDGVLTNDISYLNPADIESIDVLKDAASAAIYGSQAANGVVLVTTRRGRRGERATVTYDMFYGVQNTPRTTKMLNAYEYGTIMNEAAINSGGRPYFSQDQLNEFGQGTMWLDEMFANNAVNQNHVLGLQGGSENSIYSVSLAYTGQEGIVGGSDLSNFERYNIRVNSEHHLYNDVLTIGQNLTISNRQSSGVGVGDQYNNALRGAFNTSPLVPMFDENMNFYDNSNSDWNPNEANPYALMYYQNQNLNNNQRILGDVYMVLEPIKNLRFRTSVGLDYYSNEGRSFTPTYQLSSFAFSLFSSAHQNMGKGRTVLFDNLLTYNFSLNDKHNFETMVGSSMFQFQGSYMFASNRDVIIEDLKYAWLSNTTNVDGANINLGGGPADPDNRMSYFGRINYNYNETYLLNLTYRADGASRFARGNRFGFFPSISAGWVISNEPFMAPLENTLEFLKLRASWGQVGNMNIGFFQFMAPVSISNTNYFFGPGEGTEGLVPGAYPSRLGNTDLLWETSEQANIGIDAQLWQGRLTVNFDWYNKITRDWLIEAPILSTAGAAPPFINGGDVQNTGVELALSYNNRAGQLNYSIGVNGAYNRNRVGNIPTRDGIIHGQANQLFDNSMPFYRAQNGFPIGYFWGLQTDGIFQSEQEVRDHRSGETIIQPNAEPGDVRYVDVNGDGVIDDSDRVMLGDPNPAYTFGLTFSADYKGFDFNFLANGVAGNQIVQTYRNHANPYANYTTAILDRWHGPGSSHTMPRVTEDARNWTNFSDLYIHDGDFLRISNITLGYDLNRILNNEKLGQVRIYASVLNLYTFTKYEGMDPEIGYGSSFSSGVDLGFYPRPRTMMLGANIRF
ncbi:SusC/RagA family TonB-linked outer membrane protein [Arthrospiribacter ruber]|uniref:TonB-dependent receptor n=1 Tax=Arthrospiribacter ruber TaxID=2487934 RepID=A0A951ISJ5_9BACT|nr:TonB-dependent receptor [Arthrospiribacter ruber]MBW3466815.1 TonB-dependent receptor [Arthrospiribacter ruber]MBW3469607.1 TonB-dependent receptor [Arthrospiribacter ruber]MBW3470318.1 TonB-dependent receptor [Arthrospiribacter ruber]